MVTQNKSAPAAVEMQLDPNNPVHAELIRLREENAALAKGKADNRTNGTVSVKVKDREQIADPNKKGALKWTGGTVVTYGLGRYPTTLFASQQDRYDSPEVMAMRCKAIIENIERLSFDEETAAERTAVKAKVLANAKLRLAFLATFDAFAKGYKG